MTEGTNVTHEATRLAEEAKRLARQLSGSAYSQGVADERDSWKQQEKYDKLAREQLAQLSVAIDALAALAQPAPTAEVALPAVSKEAPQGFWMAPMMLDVTMLKAAADTPGMKAIDSSSATMQLRGYPLDPKAFEGGAPLAQAWIAMRDSWLARAQSAAKGDEARDAKLAMLETPPMQWGHRIAKHYEDDSHDA